jgi:GT2 family glycosyltransferase
LETSIIIVNHNAGDSLSDCIASVASQAAEVVLVDNASEPAGLTPVVEMFSERSGFKVNRLSRNVGFSAGCNIGAKSSNGELLLFLNPDCIATPTLVERLKEALEKHPNAAIAGGRLLGDDGGMQAGWRRKEPDLWRAMVRASGLWRVFRRWDFHSEAAIVGDELLETDAVSGACLMIRREVFEAVGGFDEGYFLHCEDLDLCAEVRWEGFAVLSCSDAVVFHSKGVCGKGRPYCVEWHKHRGMIRYFGKHLRERYSALLEPLVHVAVWCRFAVVCLRKWVSQA